MASTPVRELFTKWGFDVDDGPLEELDESIQDVKSSVILVGKVAVAAGAALFGLAKSTALSGDRLKKTGERLKINTDELQKLEFAAEQAGASASDIAGSLQNLSKVIGESRKGVGGSVEALVNLASATGRQIDKNAPLHEQFLQIGDALNQIESQQLKLALSGDLLGDSTGRLIPLFKDGRLGVEAMGRELVSLGGVISRDTLRKSAEFERNWKKILTVLNAIRFEIGGDLLEPFIDLFEDLLKAFKDNRKELEENLKIALLIVIEVFKKFSKVLKLMFNVIKGLITILGGASNAMKVLTIAVSTFSLIKFVRSIGIGVLALKKFATGFRLVGNAALIAQLKIGAIITLIALLAEDIYVFSKDGDSLIGVLIDGFLKIGSSIGKALGDPIFKVINKINKSFSSMLDDLAADTKDFLKAQGFDTLADSLVPHRDRTPEQRLKHSGDFDYSRTFGEPPADHWLNTLTSGRLADASDKLLKGVFTAPTTNTNNSNVSNASTNVNINSPISVTVPAGTSQEQVGPHIQKGIQDAFGALLRDTGRLTLSGVER